MTTDQYIRNGGDPFSIFLMIDERVSCMARPAKKRRNTANGAGLGFENHGKVG